MSIEALQPHQTSPNSKIITATESFVNFNGDSMLRCLFPIFVLAYPGTFLFPQEASSCSSRLTFDSYHGMEGTSRKDGPSVPRRRRSVGGVGKGRENARGKGSNLYFRRLARQPLNRRDKDLITVLGGVAGWMAGCCEI